MDPHHDNSGQELPDDHALSRKVEARRAETAHLLEQQRARMEQIETELLDQIQQLSSQMAAQTVGSEQLEAQQEAVRQRTVALEATAKKAEQELADARSSLEDQWDDMRRKQERLDRRLERLADEEDELENAKLATRRQRRRIADDLNRQRTELAEQREDLEQLRTQTGHDIDVRVDQLTRERDDLAERCETVQQQVAALEGQLAAAPSGDGEESAALRTEIADFQQRLEEALAERDEARRQQADLEQQLAAVPADAAMSDDSTEGLDWEAQKKRLLASLDGDGDASSAAGGGARAAASASPGTEAKDCEIAELKQQLEQLREAQPSEIDRQDAAAADALDADALVQQEREKLAALQNELRETQRKAEVEISLERAKLAREKSDLEEQISQYERDMKKLGLQQATTGETTETAPKGKSRWMSRLGLTDGEE